MNNQLWAATAVIVLGYIVGFYFQRRDSESLNRRIDDLRSDVNHRFDDLIRYIDARFKAVEDRLDRLEHPVVR
ncbi:MAG TPA: hypothetical protein VL523_10795 [Terriglobia bacterium]|nr:hypothetical protein [Terriglobia bacterium]